MDKKGQTGSGKAGDEPHRIQPPSHSSSASGFPVSSPLTPGSQPSLAMSLQSQDPSSALPQRDLSPPSEEHLTFLREQHELAMQQRHLEHQRDFQKFRDTQLQQARQQEKELRRLLQQKQGSTAGSSPTSISSSSKNSIGNAAPPPFFPSPAFLAPPAPVPPQDMNGFPGAGNFLPYQQPSFGMPPQQPSEMPVPGPVYFPPPPPAVPQNFPGPPQPQPQPQHIFPYPQQPPHPMYPNQNPSPMFPSPPLQQQQQQQQQQMPFPVFPQQQQQQPIDPPMRIADTELHIQTSNPSNHSSSSSSSSSSSGSSSSSSSSSGTQKAGHLKQEGSVPLAQTAENVAQESVDGEAIPVSEAPEFDPSAEEARRAEARRKDQLNKIIEEEDRLARKKQFEQQFPHLMPQHQQQQQQQ